MCNYLTLGKRTRLSVLSSSLKVWILLKINEFVKLGGDQLVPYYADILGAILPCISNKEEKIRVVAREINEELRAINADPTEGFDVGAILSIARRSERELLGLNNQYLPKIVAVFAEVQIKVSQFDGKLTSEPLFLLD